MKEELWAFYQDLLLSVPLMCLGNILNTLIIDCFIFLSLHAIEMAYSFVQLVNTIINEDIQLYYHSVTASEFSLPS